MALREVCGLIVDESLLDIPFDLFAKRYEVCSTKKCTDCKKENGRCTLYDKE